MFKKVGVIILMSCFSIGIINACVDVDTESETYTIDNSGCVGQLINLTWAIF